MAQNRSITRQNRSIGFVAAGLAACVIALVAVVSAVASTGNASPKGVWEQQQAKDRAVAIAAVPRASKQVRHAPSSSEKPVRQAGIINSRQGPGPSSEFLAVNSWQGPVLGSGSTWTVVWAGSTGSLSAAPGTPAVVVHIDAPTADGFGFTDTPVGTYADRAADGPLAVSSVTGETIVLVTPAGNTVRFNLQTRQFA